MMPVKNVVESDKIIFPSLISPKIHFLFWVQIVIDGSRPYHPEFNCCVDESTHFSHYFCIFKLIMSR